MFAQLSTDHLPAIRTFGDCSRYWERTKPWRGHADHAPRPLGKRSEKHKTIVKIDDNTYSLVLYKTSVVTYHADERLTINCYDTRSTVAFADRVTPAFIDPVMERGRMGVYYRNRLPTNETPHPWVTSSRPLHFTRVYDSEGNYAGWNLMNHEHAERFHVNRVNRKRAVEVRAKIEPFVQWAKAVIGLANNNLNDMFPNDETPRYRADKLYSERVALLFDSAVMPEDYPYILRSLCHKTYRGTIYAPTTWESYLLKQAYKAAGALDEVELPFGSTPVYDRYK